MKKLLVPFLLLLAACSREVPDGVTELVYASPYPPTHPFSMADQQWMDFVESRSGNSLRIVPSWGGALLSSEHSMIELRHGVADIGLITPIYVKGGVHLIRIQSGFYSYADTVEQQVALYHCLEQGSDQFAREMEGLKVLAVQGGGLPGIVTRDKPVTSLDDIAGMRLRVPNELLGVMEALGVDAITMPMGDVYSALAKGVLDGVVAPLDTFRSLHFTDVARYYANLQVPRGAYPARAIRSERWGELSSEQRDVLEQGIAVWEQAISEQTIKALQTGLDFGREQGMQFTEVSAADQARFDALYLEQAKKNADALAKYGIDGRSVFDMARSSIDANGTVSCAGGNN